MGIEVHKRDPALHPRVPTEFAWLIEIKPIVGADGPVYFGESPKGGLGQTTDHNSAVRFARKEDADAMICGMGWAHAQSTEHGWG